MRRVVISRSSVTSAPAENTVSPPVTTTARLDSTSAAPTARSNSVSMCVDSALRLCSRLSVTTATSPSQRTSTVPRSRSTSATLPSLVAKRQQVLEAPLVGLVRDDQALDLGRALPDPVDAQFAPQPLDGVVADVAAATEDLDGPVDHPVRRLGGGQLHGRCLGVQRLSQVGIIRVGLVEFPRHLVGEARLVVMSTTESAIMPWIS